MFRDDAGQVIDIARIEFAEQRIAETHVRPDDVVLELGARYGTVTAKIQSKLARKELHVAVEPDVRVLQALRNNLQEHGCCPVVFDGIVSKRPGVVEGDGYGTLVRLGASGRPCPSKTVQELEAEIGAKFTVLIADCEGCVGPFLEDFPELLDQLRLVHFETDPGYNQTNYEQVKEKLEQHGFREAEHDGWQWVFVKG